LELAMEPITAIGFHYEIEHMGMADI
jgi:hypothetical protein